jgi:hypothetical protein
MITESTSINNQTDGLGGHRRRVVLHHSTMSTVDNKRSLNGGKLLSSSKSIKKTRSLNMAPISSYYRPMNTNNDKMEVISID